MEGFETKMPKQVFQVDFLKEKEINILNGQSILSASLESGIPHYHECGGNAKCSTCRILIVEGSEHLSQRNEKEIALVEKLRLPDEIRLACQTTVNGGPVRVRRIIRDKSDIKLLVGQRDDKVGREKILVLMFLDIRNFTPFAGAHLPFDVIHVLKKMFFIFQFNIDKYGGKIIDTTGDGLYAVFGISGTLQEAARAAVIASENIISDVKELNKNYLSVHFSCSLEIGIGLHAGKVIIGNLTIDKTNRLTVMGYPVNVASRIQAATRELNNNFLISEKVAHLLPELSSGIPSQVIHVKGVTDELKVYCLGSAFLQGQFY
jgi:adenylate cyclase